MQASSGCSSPIVRPSPQSGACAAAGGAASGASRCAPRVTSHRRVPASAASSAWVACRAPVATRSGAPCATATSSSVGASRAQRWTAPRERPGTPTADSRSARRR